MTAQFELIDYEDRDKAYDNPRFIVTDAGADNDMVRLKIGDSVVKVVGKELIKAVENCMRINYPYL
jgi:hypothetical protein